MTSKHDASISIVVAVARDRVIGRDGKLPWHLPDDLRRFRRLTTGKPVVMGRKTHESIGRPLPDRHNIVMTRREGFEAPGCTVVGSFEAALAATMAAEVMVIGGASVYAAALPRTSCIYLTEVDAAVRGDVQFPPLVPDAWDEMAREHHPADAQHVYAFDFVTLRRREPIGLGQSSGTRVRDGTE